MISLTYYSLINIYSYLTNEELTYGFQIFGPSRLTKDSLEDSRSY